MEFLDKYYSILERGSVSMGRGRVDAVSPRSFERSFIVRVREGQQKNVHYKEEEEEEEEEEQKKKKKKKKKSHTIGKQLHVFKTLKRQSFNAVLHRKTPIKFSAVILTNSTALGRITYV
jgi:hypothetical protein